MNQPEELHVVVGTAAAGRAVIQELLRRGKRVRAVNRSGQAALPAGVELAAGDVADPATARAVCAGAAVVYLCAAPAYTYQAWSAQLPRMMEGVIAGAGAAGARLVYADNLYAYGQVRGPMREDLPSAPSSRKGQVRAQVAEMLLKAHADGRVQAAIGRASDFFGPHARVSVAGEDLFRAVLTGRRAMWLGSLDMPHSMTFIEDFGRGLVTLGEQERALGDVWHIPAAEPLTGRQFLELVFREAGAPPRIGTYTRSFLRLVGLFSPAVREVTEMLYQFEGPHIMDGTKYEAAFGRSATPHAEAIRATVAWYRQALGLPARA